MALMMPLREPQRQAQPKLFVSYKAYSRTRSKFDFFSI